jgi:hypothetical protein
LPDQKSFDPSPKVSTGKQTIKIKPEKIKLAKSVTLGLKVEDTTVSVEDAEHKSHQTKELHILSNAKIITNKASKISNLSKHSHINNQAINGGTKSVNQVVNENSLMVENMSHQGMTVTNSIKIDL